jgi:hypothetical protein
MNRPLAMAFVLYFAAVRIGAEPLKIGIDGRTVAGAVREERLR